MARRSTDIVSAAGMGLRPIVVVTDPTGADARRVAIAAVIRAGAASRRTTGAVVVTCGDLAISGLGDGVEPVLAEQLNGILNPPVDRDDGGGHSDAPECLRTRVRQETRQSRLVIAANVGIRDPDTNGSVAPVCILNEVLQWLGYGCS